MRKKGKIAHWNRKKGFGFIEPVDGGDNVFVHITALQKKEIPAIGTEVSFVIGEGKGGRECAVDVLCKGEKAEVTKSSSTDGGGKQLPLTLFVIPVYIAALVVLLFSSKWLLPLLGLHLVASIITFAVYAWDKSSAVNNRWRTPESTLHILALGGGWPGGLLAQHFLRHKSQKQSFRFVFWLTAVVNVAAVLYFKQELLALFIN